MTKQTTKKQRIIWWIFMQQQRIAFDGLCFACVQLKDVRKLKPMFAWKIGVLTISWSHSFNAHMQLCSSMFKLIWSLVAKINGHESMRIKFHVRTNPKVCFWHGLQHTKLFPNSHQMNKLEFYLMPFVIYTIHILAIRRIQQCNCFWFRFRFKLIQSFNQLREFSMRIERKAFFPGKLFIAPKFRQKLIT